MQKSAIATAFLLNAALLTGAHAQPPRPDYSVVKEDIADLGHGLYILHPVAPPTMGIGDTAFAVGSDGVIVIDTQFSELTPKIMEQIRAKTSLPIKYVLNTHFHGDHTGGNGDFAKTGAIVVAHANALKHMQFPPPGANGQPGTPAPKADWPVQTYSGQGTEVKIPGQTAELVHLDAGHTDGDSIVFFPAADVIITGDDLHKPGYPNIDNNNGGSIDGMIEAANFIVAHSDANTKIVPGHGPATDRAGAIAYRDMLVTARARVAAEIKKGMTEQQVLDAHPLADLDKSWIIPGNAASARFPALVYQSLKKQGM